MVNLLTNTWLVLADTWSTFNRYSTNTWLTVNWYYQPCIGQVDRCLANALASPWSIFWFILLADTTYSKHYLNALGVCKRGLLIFGFLSDWELEEVQSPLWIHDIMEAENLPCNCHQMIVRRKHHFSINTKTSREVAMDPVKHPTTFKLVKRMI